jgi:ferritin-like metal-binding protein YciE
MAKNDYFANRLQNAHAIEQALESSLEREIKDAENFPDIQEKYRQLLVESKEHQLTLEKLMDKYDTGPSGLKSGMVGILGGASELVSSAYDDKPLLDVIANAGRLRIKKAAYASLAITADHLKDNEATAMLKKILESVRKADEWITDQIPRLTKHYAAELAEADTR